MAKMLIDFWGDITCPYCYIGGHILQQTLEALPYKGNIQVRWKSCLLHTNLKEGVYHPFQYHLQQAGLSMPEIQEKVRNITSYAKRYGVELHVERSFSANTTNAARLLKEANRHNCTLPVLLALGRGEMVEGLNMSDPEHLKTKAIQGGMPAALVNEVLNSTKHLDEVQRDQKEAQHKAYNYVPTLYIHHKHCMEGQLEAEPLKKLIHNAYQEYTQEQDRWEAMEIEQLGADSCGIECEE